VWDDRVGMNTGILPLQLLNVGYHDDYGYHTEIPKDSADAVCAYLGDMCVFCERAGNTGIPCAEGNSVIIFGKRNPFRLQEELEAELVPKVVIDVSHWRYGNTYSDVVDAVLWLGDIHKSKRAA